MICYCLFRFTGSHTGQRISDVFEEVVSDRYNIVNILEYIITDNASNMRKAFSVCFPAAMEQNFSSNGDELAATVYNDADCLDDPDLWNDLDLGSQSLFDDAVDQGGKKKRLQCFTHSLQLTVGDGLRHTAAINLALSKCSKICTQLHSSCLVKEKFEDAFGKKLSIPADVATRWNSTLRQVMAVIKLDMLKLNDIFRENAGHLIFTVKEWSQLIELATILNPFGEATDATQGQHIVTSSYAAPSVISLYRHCVNQNESARFLKKLAAALRDSLMKRFKGKIV